MPKGNDTFTVAYLDTSGQAGYNSVRTVTSYTWQVVFFATNTQVTSSPATPVTGQPVTLTTPVTPSSGAAVLPTGTLTFTVNGTPVTCSSPATLNGPTRPWPPAPCPTDSPVAPTSSRPTYPGDTWYAASIGSLSLTVARRPPPSTGSP